MKLPFQVDLKEKVIVVTGAAGVLMDAFAEALIACNGKVVLMARKPEQVEAMLKKYDSEQVMGVCADCLDKASLLRARDEIHERFGNVNILINGAGGNHPAATTDNEEMTPDTGIEVKTFFDLEEEGLRKVFDTNIITAMLATQVFAEDMVKIGGNVINITSMNGFRPLTKIPAYSSAKAGLANLTQWMSVHFAPCNIRVNAIAPGFFVTKQNHDLLFQPDGTPTPRTEKILAGTPQKRFGKTEDLIGTLLWLVCDEASGFVTGTVIPVDGGFNAYSGV